MQKCAALQPRQSLPFLEVQGQGEIATLKSILLALELLPVLRGHCNSSNFRDFIKAFLFLMMKKSVGEKVHSVEP